MRLPMMRLLAPVRVRCERSAKCPNPGFCSKCAEWIATCRVCDERLSADEHHEALAWAHGHMHVRHPGWHGPRRLIIQPPTHEQLAAIRPFDFQRIMFLPQDEA